MSPNIWTQCEGPTRPAPLATQPWRVVEGQHVNSTRKLVDSNAEQALLEELIDRAKSRVPPGAEFERLHYLLFTPFRHPPLRSGTRFGSRHQRGIFYASRDAETCLAEWAFYRFVFLEGTSASLGTTSKPLTVFRSEVHAARAIDLTASPFNDFRTLISSPGSYVASQPLGTAMRDEGIEACAFFSARDPEGVNYALFEPCFGSAKPLTEEHWSCTFDRELVEMRRTSVFVSLSLSFPRSRFEIDGVLPVPALA